MPGDLPARDRAGKEVIGSSSQLAPSICGVSAATVVGHRTVQPTKVALPGGKGHLAARVPRALPPTREGCAPRFLVGSGDARH
jgi:hypothetical protein